MKRGFEKLQIQYLQSECFEGGLQCKGVTDGRTTCLLYYNVSVFKLIDKKSPQTKGISSFLQYQMLWIDQNDKTFFFLMYIHVFCKLRTICGYATLIPNLE